MCAVVIVIAAITKHFFFSSRRRHTRSVSAFLLNRSSDLPTTLPTAYDVYPLDGRHDGGYYTVKDCVTIEVLPPTPGNNVYVGCMVWSNFTATKYRGLVSLNQVIKEISCLQPLKRGDLCLVLLLAVLLLLLLVAPCLNCLEAVKKPPPVAFKVMCLLPITIL